MKKIIIKSNIEHKNGEFINVDITKGIAFKLY
jgi:hypothetical protein